MNVRTYSSKQAAVRHTEGMGLFFTSNKNKLSSQEIDDALHAAGGLEQSDEAEVRRRLRQRSAGGITRQDVEKVIRALKKDKTDSVSSAEADIAKRNLLEKLDD